MPNSIIINTLLDSEPLTVIRINITGDGSGEEFTIIYSPTSYQNPTVKQRLMRCQYSLAGFNALLSWDDTNPAYRQPIISLEEGVYSDCEFECGISNNPLASRNGQILMNTYGLGNEDHGYLILTIKHDELMPGTP